MKKFIYSILFLSGILISCQSGEKKVNSSAEKTKTVLEALNDSIAKDSSNYALFNRRARYFLSENQLNPALNDLNKALKINPKEPELFLTLAEIYFKLGKNENTTASLLKAVELDPYKTEAYNKLSQLNILTQRFDIALAYNDKALMVEPFNAKSLYIRGMVFLARQDTVSAMKNFLLSRDASPDFYESLIQIGAIYSKQHNPLAADYLHDAVRRFPDAAQARYELALYLQENGSPEKAMAHYDTLMMQFPVNKFVLYNIGYLYLVFGQQPDSALYYFDRSLAIDPHYLDAMYNKGRTFEEMGKYMAAREIYQDVLKDNTNYQLAIDGLNRLDRKR
jgi:tetratricopeptide (TPR) repeat protein